MFDWIICLNWLFNVWNWLIDWIGISVLNGIKTPTLPADKRKNSFTYELIELVELIVMNCFINSNCRDEQVGGIERIPQIVIVFILIYMNCWCYNMDKPVGWNWLNEFGWMIFNITFINQYLVLILEMGNLQWMT